MPRKAEGPRPLTPAQRQARQRERRAAQAEIWRRALEQIAAAKSVRDARRIASEALGR